MVEIGTDENFGDKTGGDSLREHCTDLVFFIKWNMNAKKNLSNYDEIYNVSILPQSFSCLSTIQRKHRNQGNLINGYSNLIIIRIKDLFE